MSGMDKLFDAVRRWARPWPTGAEPMEIRRAVLDEVETQTLSSGVGKRIFPYNRLRVRLLALSPEERVRFEALVHDAWDLPGDIRKRLTECGCAIPPGFEVNVEVTDQAAPEFGDRRYHIAYERTEGKAAQGAPATPSASTVAVPSPFAEPGRPVVELTVLQGTATQRVYAFPAGRLYVGRLEEILDEEGRVRRRNDVAFTEEGDVNQTVSREHARLLFDEGSGEVRLRAEPGASSTRIFRDGRSIDVSPRDTRGVRIQSGDEIYFGKARVKVAIRSAG